MELIETIVCTKEQETTKKQSRRKENNYLLSTDKCHTPGLMSQFPMIYLMSCHGQLAKRVFQTEEPESQDSEGLTRSHKAARETMVCMTPHQITQAQRTWSTGLRARTCLSAGLCLKPSRGRLRSSICSLKFSCLVLFLYYNSSRNQQQHYKPNGVTSVLYIPVLIPSSFIHGFIHSCNKCSLNSHPGPDTEEHGTDIIILFLHIRKQQLKKVNPKFYTAWHRLVCDSPKRFSDHLGHRPA